MRAWEEFVQKQEKELGSATIQKWLRPFKVVRFDAGNLYLEAPDSFKAAWFNEHIRPKITPHLVTSGNKKIKLHITIATQHEQTPSSDKKAIQSQFGKNSPLTFDDVNPDFTFDNFISSESNLLAYKLLQESSGHLLSPEERIPPPLFNPIYLYGRSGTGKTHLMMAAANSLKARGQKVIYVRAESFTEHVVEAIRIGEMQQFRRAYRFVDTLFIDDIEVFSRKNATQEEFFHTFNTLHLEGKQIIIGSTLPPSSLKFIEPRLISRFEWGIVIPMDHLPKESMRAVLLQKSNAAHFPLRDEVSEYLLETFTSNLKNLLRAFDALILRTHLNQGITAIHQVPLSLETAKKYIADLIEVEEKSSLTSGKIIRVVAEHYGISIDDILSKAQNRECALPRQIAMHLCRHQLNMPFMKIGDLFSRDHSTVMSSIKQVQKNLEGKNQEISSSMSSILKRLEI